MKVHVLPGDALTEEFKETNIDGALIVCRECLVDGDVRAENLEDFWQVRADFIVDSYGEEREKYFASVRREFEKLQNLASAGAEINLWFEYELFCQVNMWFCLSLLNESEAQIFRVAPVVCRGDEVWKGFGGLDAADLEECHAERREFSKADVRLGADLWKAFQTSDYKALEKLSMTESECFPYLREVCRAEIEKNSKPRKVLEEIIAAGKTDFAEIFPAFSAQAGVYGYGDSQVKRIFDSIKN